MVVQNYSRVIHNSHTIHADDENFEIEGGLFLLLEERNEQHDDGHDFDETNQFVSEMRSTSCTYQASGVQLDRCYKTPLIGKPAVQHKSVTSTPQVNTDIYL